MFNFQGILKRSAAVAPAMTIQKGLISPKIKKVVRKTENISFRSELPTG